MADELRALDQTTKHFTTVSSLPLLGLKYFHKYLEVFRKGNKCGGAFLIYSGRPAGRQMP